MSVGDQPLQIYVAHDRETNSGFVSVRGSRVFCDFFFKPGLCNYDEARKQAEVFIAAMALKAAQESLIEKVRV